MLQTISILCGALVLSGCASQPTPQVTPTNQGICVALAKRMPVQYHRLSVDEESARNIQLANAAYRTACGVK